MIKIKSVVKVMNFHSLLRVDSARKKAEKYFKSEVEITKMISSILNNRNLILDKKILKPNPNGFALDIFIGNDYGFCGNFNSTINSDIRENKDSYKIIVGKKMFDPKDKTILKITKKEFLSKFFKIEEIISKGIKNSTYREINIIYIHYYSINNYEFVRKTLFPVEFENDKDIIYNEDYLIETDVNDILVNLISIYICYKIRIAETNSWASENLMRQQITRESLKKIDEIDSETLRKELKQKKSRDFKKLIENYGKKGV